MRSTQMIGLVMVLFSASLFVACKKISSRKDLENIQELEQKADKAREMILTGEVDTTVLAELGRAYLTFADQYPEAPETPDFLFRAGELYSNDLGRVDKAIQVFDRNFQSYPQHPTAANALFLMGYLNHNVLQNLVQAEKNYRTFLEKYPDHKMAATAEFELQYLGKSPEEVFRQFIVPEDSSVADSSQPLP